MSPIPAKRYLNQSSPPHISTLILLAALPALAMNMFLPSLPAMSQYFQTDYSVMQLSVSLYLGVSAILQLLISPLSDRYGRRPVILWSIFLFLIATLGCLLAPNVEIFLICRMAQAVIATCMALSRSVVRDMVPEAQAASMIGYVTMGMSVSPMLGPLLGGVLDSYLGWQANFVLMLAAGAMLWLVTWRDLGETTTNRSASFSAQMRQYPGLLRSKQFWGYCLSASFSAGAFYAYLGAAAFVGTEVFNLNPIWMGLTFGIVSLGYMLGNFLSGRFAVRMGINKMVMAGALLASIGLGGALVLFCLGLGSAYVFFGFIVLLGVGNGLTLPSANAGMLSVRPDLAGSASGLSGAILIGIGTLLSLLSGTVLTIESGAIILLWIMLLSSLASVLCIWLVIRRQRRLGIIRE